MNEVLVDARCVDWDWRLNDNNGRYEKAYVLSLTMRMWFREHNVAIPSVAYSPKNGWSKRDKVSFFFEDASQAMMFKLKWVPEDYL